MDTMCIIVVKITNITAIKFNRTSQISQYVGRAIMDITFIKDIMVAKDITPIIAIIYNTESPTSQSLTST